MKAFIEISKLTRKIYHDNLPFIAVMCRNVMRDSVKERVDKYIKFKEAAYTA